MPFGAAMALAIPQQNAHLYMVAGAVAPAVYALYRVGCFQLPVVDLLYTPTSEVLMVRLGELDKQGRLEEGVVAFREAAGSWPSSSCPSPRSFSPRRPSSSARSSARSSSRRCPSSG